MGEINYPPLKEADVFDASSLNSRQARIEEAINDVAAGAVAVGGLNENHLPAFTKVTTPASVTRRVGGLGAAHIYTENQVTYPNFVPIDSSGSAGGGTDLQLDFGSGYALAGEVQGILVMADVHIQSMTTDNSASPDSHNAGAWAGFRIEVSLNGVAWTAIPRSFRLQADSLDAASNRLQQLKVSLRTLVLASDLAAVRYVRVVMTQDLGGSSADQRTVLRECQLSAIVLKSKKV
tara:strand:- start:843 stop:1547 length:705 start_codon:yes stop_codon:yes gene_type:complete